MGTAVAGRWGSRVLRSWFMTHLVTQGRLRPDVVTASAQPDPEADVPEHVLLGPHGGKDGVHGGTRSPQRSVTNQERSTL